MNGQVGGEGCDWSEIEQATDTGQYPSLWYSFSHGFGLISFRVLDHAVLRCFAIYAAGLDHVIEVEAISGVWI